MYHEIKYPLNFQEMKYVKEFLDAQLSGSDPFPVGKVSSVYFDTLDLDLYKLCVVGSDHKQKFRLRSYREDGAYHQFQIKTKENDRVKKVKVDFEAMSPQIQPTRYLLSKIIDNAKDQIRTDLVQQKTVPMVNVNDLNPVVEIIYTRHRYQDKDYRITLDSNIHSRPIGGFGQDHYFPESVLEIKTEDPNPDLPFLGALKLKKGSFSKYKQAIQNLNYNESSLYGTNSSWG